LAFPPPEKAVNDD
jgi:MATE family multidrug resistance protein